MSSKGKGGRNAVVEKKKTSRSEKADLKFPVGRIGRMLKNGRYAKRVAAGAPVYLAAVLEFLCVEILDSCAPVTKANGRCRIIPRDMLTVIREEADLSELFKGITLSTAGVIPHINSALLPAKSGKKAEASQAFDN